MTAPHAVGQLRRQFGPFDLVLLVTAILMVVTDLTVLFFHLMFVLLTFGAFFWSLAGFAVRASVWVAAVTAVVATAVLAERTQVEELIEIPLLSTILVGVFLIARHRAQVQAQLLEHDQVFLQAVLENMEDGVIACDSAGRLAFVNDALRTFCGLPRTSRPEEWGDALRLYDADGATPVASEDGPLECAWRGQLVEAREYVIVPPTGPARLLLATGKRMTSAGGQALGAVVVLRDITERRLAEERLQHSLDALLTLYEASQVLGSTLEWEDLGSSLLGIVQRVSGLTAAMLSLRDEHQQLRPWQTIGPAPVWQWADATAAAQTARDAALTTGEPQVVRWPGPAADSMPLVGVWLPLRVHDRVIGVLEAYGSAELAEQAMLETLGSLASQAASALENAQLYQELAERERRLQDLVGQLIVAQEDERRRVAYDLHDGLAQIAAAAHQHLQAFVNRYPPAVTHDRENLAHAVELVRQTVREARRVIAGLRPSVLDDFGLAIAIRQQVDHLDAEGWQITYEAALGNERVSTAVETALFRVAQEALTNVEKHARTTRVHITLDRLDGQIRLQLRDWGCGFDPTRSFGNGLGERIGLAGMRERVALLGGTLAIDSQLDIGTVITADIPLPAETAALNHA